MSSDEPYWPREEPGAEMMFRKGDQGEQGEKGEPGMTPGARHAFMILTVIIFLFAAAGLIMGARAYNGLQSRQLTMCQFNHDLGDLASVPVTLNPHTHKASKIGIAIIADSRSAFRGLGCHGVLTKPGPSFTRWARHYGLPAT